MHTAYDWWSDIWLPAIGAILVPFAIAFCTWWFGASRAEKNKEIQELRDNLNFLVSIALSSMNGLIFLEKRLQDIVKREKKALSIMEAHSKETFSFDDVFYGFVYDDVFKTVSMEKYAPCIEYIPHFVADITLVKSLLNSLDFFILERNDIIFSIANCEDLEHKRIRNLSQLPRDYESISGLVNETYRITLLLRNIIANVVKLNNDIKDLKLVPQCYNKEQLDFIKKSETEFTKQENQKKEGKA